MSRYSSADVGFLLINGLNVLGDMTDIEDTYEAVTEDVTVLGDAAEQHAAVGVKRYEINQKGFYNDATGRSNAALVGIGTSKILSFAPEGNTLGKVAPCTSLVQATYKRQIVRNALHKAEATYMSAYGHDEARIIHALAARTADGDTEAASYDGLAQSTAGATCYLQVTALTLGGYDSVTITVLDDADNSGSFGTLVAFTNVTEVGAERKTIAGTVERYLAVSYVFNGSGSDPSIEFMVAVKRN